jgi:hypothetical protein
MKIHFEIDTLRQNEVHDLLRVAAAINNALGDAGGISDATLQQILKQSKALEGEAGSIASGLKTSTHQP